MAATPVEVPVTGPVSPRASSLPSRRLGILTVLDLAVPGRRRSRASPWLVGLNFLWCRWLGLGFGEFVAGDCGVKRVECRWSWEGARVSIRFGTRDRSLLIKLVSRRRQVLLK